MPDASLNENVSSLERSKFFRNEEDKDNVTVRVAGKVFEPFTAAKFQMEIDIENGVDISEAYMVNDNGEVLVTNQGQILRGS